MSKPVLGYWDIRGLAERIRLLLKYAGVDFEDKRYAFTDTPPSYGSEVWFNEKPSHDLDFPNLPYWKEESGFKLTETKAVFKYVALKYAGHLVPSSPEEYSRAEMVISVADGFETALANHAYGMVFPDAKPISEATKPARDNLTKFLGDQPWIMGNKLTYVDFFLYEVLKIYTKFDPKFLDQDPALKAYMKRFEELPELAEHLKSIEGLMCYSPFATIKF